MSRGRSDDGFAKPKNDAYTGMLGLSLLGLIIGCVLLFLDYSQYPSSPPPAAQKVQPFSANPPQEGAPKQP
jgi:hypothetical protein